MVGWWSGSWKYLHLHYHILFECAVYTYCTETFRCHINNVMHSCRYCKYILSLSYLCPMCSWRKLCPSLVRADVVICFQIEPRQQTIFKGCMWWLLSGVGFVTVCNACKGTWAPQTWAPQTCAAIGYSAEEGHWRAAIREVRRSMPCHSNCEWPSVWKNCCPFLFGTLQHIWPRSTSASSPIWRSPWVRRACSDTPARKCSDDEERDEWGGWGNGLTSWVGAAWRPLVQFLYWRKARYSMFLLQSLPAKQCFGPKSLATNFKVVLYHN